VTGEAATHEASGESFSSRKQDAVAAE